MKTILIIFLTLINILFLFLYYSQRENLNTTYMNKENFILACQKELLNNNIFKNQNFSSTKKVEISLIYCLCMSEALEERHILQKSYLDNKIYHSNSMLLDFLDSNEGSQVTLDCTTRSLL